MGIEVSLNGYDDFLKQMVFLTGKYIAFGCKALLPAHEQTSITILLTQ
jgi:hypothetical protein